MNRPLHRAHRWRLAIAAAVALLCAVALFRFFQPLQAEPVVFPFGIISRSQAELMARGGGGRFAFQGQAELSSRLSTYAAARRELLPDLAGAAEPDSLVWVVDVRGPALFRSPDPAAPTQTQPRQRTYTLVIDVIGNLRLERARP